MLPDVRRARTELEAAKKDAQAFLNDAQYLHVVGLVKRLASFGNRRELADLRLEKIKSEIWELKDKGGILGKINVRVFFAALPERKQMLSCDERSDAGTQQRDVAVARHG